MLVRGVSNLIINPALMESPAQAPRRGKVIITHKHGGFASIGNCALKMAIIGPGSSFRYCMHLY
jgi:hypothetical protein